MKKKKVIISRYCKINEEIVQENRIRPMTNETEFGNTICLCFWSLRCCGCTCFSLSVALNGLAWKLNERKLWLSQNAHLNAVTFTHRCNFDVDDALIATFNWKFLFTLFLFASMRKMKERTSLNPIYINLNRNLWTCSRWTIVDDGGQLAYAYQI